eukprot:GEMP01001306.1.p1 GENE.GEMP01001306.1~~GEMP01001306.1.p1  ORF type:complete len:1145 (+),score=265.37 GEMP01001306.1:50-3484(+)
MRQQTLFDCWRQRGAKDDKPIVPPKESGALGKDDDDAPLMSAPAIKSSPPVKRAASPKSRKETTVKRPRKSHAKENSVDNGVVVPPTTPPPTARMPNFQGFNLDAMGPSLSSQDSTVASTPASASAPSEWVPSAQPASTTSPVGNKIDNFAMGNVNEELDLSTGIKVVTDEPVVEDKDLNSATMTLERDGMNAFAAECIYNYHLTSSDYSYPTWLKPENLRDINGRRPTDSDYDQRTLWVPSEAQQKEEKTGTPMLLQFWKVKSLHFDKVAFFKVGKFYEIFYLDAVIAQRVCGLKWMNADRKPHVGFPEVALHVNASKLVEAGYSAIVVEQTETVEEARSRTGHGTPLVQREACEVFTRGTLVHHDMVSQRDNNYLAVMWFGPMEDGTRANELPSPYDFAVILIDTATGDARVGSFRDDADRNALRTMMAQVQPKEIVYHPLNVSQQAIKMLKLMPCRPMLTPWCGMPCSVPAAEVEMRRFEIEYPEDVKKRLAQAPVTICTGGAFAYLKVVMLDQQVVPFMKWSVYDPFSVSKHMMLDATALTNLDIVETEDGQYKGSLLHFLDRTSTAFGFRLFKRWLCAPLLQPDEINARLDCVDFFQQRSDVREASMKALKSLPDLERMTARVSAFGVQGERQAVLYGDEAGRRMKDFLKLLSSFDSAHELVCSIQRVAGLPARLKQLVEFRPEGMFPDVSKYTSAFRSKIEILDQDGKEIYRPCPGVFDGYDEQMSELRDLESDLENILHTWQCKNPSAEMKFIHRLPAYRYEIEVAENALPKNVTQCKHVDITSSRKGFIRFQTQEIKDLLLQYDSILQKAKDMLYPFMGSMFKEFHLHAANFSLATSVVAEIDALISLALVCDCPYGPMVRPEFVPVGPDDNGVLDFQDLRHPVAEHHCDSFVPNDVACGGVGQPAILLVTGPNMGGKSTVLRQTCIGVIMAQIGCKVPASRGRLTPVDRIFTRVGAQDSLIEGKSTFLMELEETSSILHFASKRSLAVIDELGRGTSTFDGAAIALATLEHLATLTQCRCLFATHYHLLGTYQSPMVKSFHLAADVDAQTGELTFLYKFTQGLCPDSHGHNVARLAGLPDKVAIMAREKSQEWRRSHNTQGAEFLMQEMVRLAKDKDEAALTKLLMRGTDGSRCL